MIQDIPSWMKSILKKCVLEFGPGDFRHHKFWKSKPRKYIIADVHEGMMQIASSVLQKIKSVSNHF